MWLRISSSDKNPEPSTTKAFMRFTFPPVFCHVRESGGIQPPLCPDRRFSEHKTRAIVTFWPWILGDADFYRFSRLYLTSPWFVLPTATSRGGGERLPAHHRHVSTGSIPTPQPSHRESFLCRGHSLWITRQIQAPRAAASAKLAYPVTPQLPLVERISGWRRANCTSPSAIPTSQHIHHTRAPQPRIRGSKNDTKPPLPHLNMTYAKSSLAGAEDQGP